MKFIENYTVGAMSCIAAARAAGYCHPEVKGSSLLKMPYIAAEVERRRAMLEERSDFKLRDLLEFSVLAATYDPSSIMVPGTNQFRPMSEWPNQRLRRLVESVKTKRFTDSKGNVTEQVEYRFIQRNPNLDRIAHLFGVPRLLNIKMEETRSIPVSVIDRLTNAIKESDLANRTVNAESRLTIGQVDSVKAKYKNQNGNSGTNDSSGSPSCIS